MDRANRYARARGPDKTKMIEVDGMIFVHNLLHISGAEPTYQPVVSYEHSIVLLYNGEIYNYDKNLYQTDTECIIPAYLEHGHNFAKHLDGEFAIVLIDLKTNQLIYTTDAFMTKPLFVALSEKQEIVGLATYASMLIEVEGATVIMANPNETVVYDLNNKRVCHRDYLKHWNLTQKVDGWDDWQVAFEQAVRKRIPTVPFFVCLSSGYDSGAICLALNRLECEYATVSSFHGENEDVLKERIRINAMMSYGIGRDTHIYAKPWNEIEPFTFVHQDHPHQATPIRLQDDGGANGMNAIGGFMRELGYKVSLSGSGADEIISDYGFNGQKIYPHSEFGGRFPEDLSAMFPWKKFYNDTQRSYLFKDEFVCGAHGIEGRYPFLDVDVVQAFLNTTATRKNEAYKAPIIAYLKRYGYPVDEGIKKGFSAPC